MNASMLTTVRGRTRSTTSDRQPDGEDRAGSRTLRPVRGRAADDFLEMAREYLRRGWSVIPVNGKKPAHGLKWKPFSQRKPTEGELSSWFSGNGVTGLAVVLGQVSGDLGCRDFDAPGAYECWAESEPEIAAKLPTVKSARGFNVYFQSAARLRTQTLGDGELRGEGGYCVLPRSVHPSGHVYQWMIPLPDAGLPVVNADECGLSRTWAPPSPPNPLCPLYPPLSTLSTLPALPALPALSSLYSTKRQLVKKQDLGPQVAKAVALALPTDIHQNHKKLFVLARALKAVEKRRGREFSQEELRRVFGQWHVAARRWLRPEKSSDDYWFEFLEARDNAKYPLGEGVLQRAWEAAQKAPLPKVARQFETPSLRLLVALCRELQRAAGDAPFYLSYRMAQTLLRPQSSSTAALWLKGLVRSRVIKVIVKGGPETNKATRYRYLHPL